MFHRIKFFKYILILSFMVFELLPLTLKAQDPLKDLRVIGSNVNIIFSTMSHYNNGITLTGWTRVKIRYRYTGQTNWVLRVNATDSKIRYEGNPIHDIDLDKLVLTANITSNTNTTAVLNPLFVLSDVDPGDILVGGTQDPPPLIGEIELSITYQLGLPPDQMLNKPDGLYFVGLRFLLVEN